MTIRDACFPSSEGGCASKALQRSACPETLFLTAFLTSAVILCELRRPQKVEEIMNKNDSDVMYNGSGFLLILLSHT